MSQGGFTVNAPTKRRPGDSTTDAEHRLYVAADGVTVVGVGDPRAARLIATPGRPIPEQHLEAALAYAKGAPAESGGDGPSGLAEGDTGAQGSGSVEGEAYDPAAYKVDEVVAHLRGLVEADTDEARAEYERILKAEEAGSHRKGILGG
jgi:hypothetical protein